MNNQSQIMQLINGAILTTILAVMGFLLYFVIETMQKEHVRLDHKIDGKADNETIMELMKRQDMKWEWQKKTNDGVEKDINQLQSKMYKEVI